MKTRITWFEGVALLVEKKFPIGHGPWMVAYLIAMIALLPSVLSLSLGTGVVAYAYATGGLYSQGGFSEAGTLLWNVAATALGWFLCSWLVLTWRMFRAHRKGEPYTSPCYLWLSGAVVLADLALVMVGILLAQNTTFGAVLPVACILVLHFLHKRLSHRFSQSA